MIDDCKSFGCSSVDVEDVRKEQKKTKSSHGNAENIPDFWVQKGATHRWENAKHPCVLQQSF